MQLGEFGLLGPVEIGGGRRIGAAKPRALLVSLLLEPGRVRSLDLLTSILWAEAPPVSARNLISGYVGDLRRLLGPDVAIRWGPAGYLIDVEPGRIDWFRFLEGVRDARAVLDAGDCAAALDGLTEALALWRGPPLCDVESRILQEIEVPRMTTTRVAAEKQRIELALRLGRHEAERPRLDALTAEFPLDEDFYRLAMLAEHRAGQRTAALAVYQRASAVLRAELGVAPNRPLRELAEAIRAGEHLDPAPGPKPVCELPPDLADFTGRAPELVRLTGILSRCGQRCAAPAVVVVHGPAGVGKSALALRAAWSVRDRFPDGQLHAGLRTDDGARTEPAELLGQLLTALGVGTVPAGTPARVRLYRSLAAGRRLLVVLDDAVDEKQVRMLLPTGPGSATIVTCRRPLAGLAGAQLLRLGLFAPTDATLLLERVVGAHRLGPEPEAVRDLIGLCAHLPLGVRVVAARLACRPDWTVADLVDRLRDEHRRLDELVAGDLAIRPSFAVSYRECDPAARRLFRRLGLLGVADAPVTVIKALLPAADPAEVERLLDRLVELGLVSVVRRDARGRPRYRCHELLALFARECLAAEDPAVELRSIAVHRHSTAAG